MSNYTSATRAYRKTEVSTSDPIDLVIMLYDGVESFMKKALSAINDRKVADKSAYLTRSMAIIEELLRSLDVEVGGQAAENLQELYLYLMKEIAEINLTSDAEKLQRAMEIVSTLRDAWKGVKDTAQL